MKLTGIGASDGIAVASAWRLEQVKAIPKPEKCGDSAAEAARFAAAQEKAIAELTELYEQTRKTDTEAANIFDIHRMMVEDLDFVDGVEAILSEGLCAQWAVYMSGEALAQMLASLEDENMRARAADITDVSGRLCRILMGIPEQSAVFTENVIVLAEDLLPSQTLKLDRAHVVGFVTKNGSVTSHSAILARTMGIPCIVGVGESYEKLLTAKKLAMDGAAGEVIADPDDAELEAYRQKSESYSSGIAELEKYRGVSAVTKSGHKTLVCANIGSVADADTAVSCSCDGVGLFRSEFLYLESSDFPDEETQFKAYKSVLEKLSPRSVVIRTLDLGSDKQAPYFSIPDEENPAMGYRAIRICLAQPDIFRTQLRALLRASVYGKLCIMFPMITGLSQVLQIKEIFADVKAQLKAEGIAYSSDVQVGIMVETPAAAVMSDVLAREVDFFSIGTNDLTQYTMAADRMNARVSGIFNASDPAVLRFIEMTVKNAHEAGIWVGICGEAGANTDLTQFFMDIGVDELSVAPASVLKVKKAVCQSA